MDAHEARVALDVQARRLWQDTKDAPRSPELAAALDAALMAANSGIGVAEAQAALSAALGSASLMAVDVPAALPTTTGDEEIP